MLEIHLKIRQRPQRSTLDHTGLEAELRSQDWLQSVGRNVQAHIRIGVSKATDNTVQAFQCS
jgi:hypothetical protein